MVVYINIHRYHVHVRGWIHSVYVMVECKSNRIAVEKKVENSDFSYH